MNNSLCSSNAVLVLHLEFRWFDMITRGVKLYEFRDLRKYNSRFRNSDGTIRHFDYVVFAWGYPPFGYTQRWAAFEVLSLSIGEGRPEWGAVAGKLYWHILLGDKVDVLPWLSHRLILKKGARNDL